MFNRHGTLLVEYTSYTDKWTMIMTVKSRTTDYLKQRHQHKQTASLYVHAMWAACSENWVQIVSKFKRSARTSNKITAYCPDILQFMNTNGRNDDIYGKRIILTELITTVEEREMTWKLNWTSSTNIVPPFFHSVKGTVSRSITGTDVTSLDHFAERRVYRFTDFEIQGMSANGDCN